MSEFKKNDLVQHPLMPEWGLGRIISDDSRGTRIYFSKQGMKVLRLDKMDWNLKRLENDNSNTRDQNCRGVSRGL